MIFFQNIKGKKMFVRTKSTPNSPRKSIQIVESIRDGNKVKQRIIRHVGIAMNDKEEKKLKDLAEFIKAEIEQEHTPSLFSPEVLAEMAISSRRQKEEDFNVKLNELKEEQRTVVGIHDVYGRIFNELGFNKLLKSHHGLSANTVLKNVILARIANPSSKRSSVMHLEKDFGIQINLEKVYRMMDKLDDNTCLQMQEMAYQSTLKLFNGKIDVIFFDATTLYFESFTEDKLKKNGFSKDHKFNQPQVLLSLMVTKDGLPIGYNVYPGSTYEGNTLIPALKKIKEKYEVDKVVFVADAGLFNKQNLSQLNAHGFKYIVASRLRSLSREWKEKILNQNFYTQKKLGEKLATFEYEKDKRLIVTYNDERARKNSHDRKKAIEKLLQKLNKNKSPSGLISNYGYKKFLKMEGKSTVTINEKKISEDAKWDGLHGIITNCFDMTEEDALSHYRGLWQVEESFRITKHDLKVRPIFHWTPRRVKAHIAIAFMAFCAIRNLEYRIKIQYKKLSPEAIRIALTRVQASILKDQNGQRYVVPSKFSYDAKKIYQFMGLSTSSTPYKLSKTEI